MKASAMNLLRAVALVVTTQSTEAFLTKMRPTSILHNNNIISLGMSVNESNGPLSEAKQRISEAISIGAPIYNAGDVQKCVDIYKDVAKQILPILPSSFQTKLQKELKESANNCNPDEQAWALRRIFDSIFEFRAPIIPQHASRDISFEKFTTAQIGEPLEVMDNVMGGISMGKWQSDSNTFSGKTSLANNGGFASVRWRFTNVQNWSYANGVYMKGVKHSAAEEHTFSLLLKDDICERVRLANFKAVFANPEQNEGTLLLPFTVFDQMEQMGNPLVGSPAFNPLAVTEIGLMAIKPTVIGEFQLRFFEWGLYVDENRE